MNQILPNQLKKLIIAIAFFSFALYAKSLAQSVRQYPVCGNAAPTMQQVEQLNAVYKESVQRNRQARPLTDINYFPVQFIIAHKSDGSGGADYTTINQGLAQLNRFYLPAGIQFYIAPNGFTEVSNDSLFDVNTSRTNIGNTPYMVPNAINVFLVNSLKDNYGTWGGQAPLPSVSKEGNNAVINWHYLTEGKVFPHEMGHYFGLYHPHDNQAQGARELVNGSNCATTADQVCDTPADPFDLTGNPRQLSCTYTYDVKDANGQAYSPLLSNMMSYWYCPPFSFTNGQYERMYTIGIAGRTNPNNQYTLNAPATEVKPPLLLANKAVTGPIKLTWQDQSANETGFIIERSAGTADKFVAVDGVAPNVTQWAETNALAGIAYYYRIKASNSLQYSNIESFKAGYCLPLHRDEWSCASSNGTIGIESVKIWSANKASILLDSKGVCSQNGNAYSDLTNRPAIALLKGAPIPFQLEAMKVQAGANKGTIYAMRVSIWVDLNQDQTYTENERLFVSVPAVAYPNPLLDAQFTIPSTALPGLTRMRIRAGTAFVATPESACEQIDGETEDYLVNIGGICSLSANLTASKSTTLCQGSSTTLTGSATGGQGTLSYTWQRDNTPLAETTNVLSVSAAGVYRFIATDPGSCSASSSLTAVVTARPQPTVAGSASVCAGQTSVLTVGNAVGTGPFTYNWLQNQASVATSSSLSATVAGNYVVVMTDANGCTGTSAGFALMVKPNPDAQISGVTLLPGGLASLSASPGGSGSTYQWLLSGAALAGATSATYTVRQSGSYQVVAVGDGCMGTSFALAVNLAISGGRLSSEATHEPMSMTVSPNPSSAQFMIQLRLPEPTSATLSITNLLGHLVGQWHLDASRTDYEQPVDLRTLPGGTYLISAEAGGQRLVRRVQKE